LPADEIEIKHGLHCTLLHAPDDSFGCIGEELSIQVRSIAVALLMIIGGGDSIALICRDRW